MSITLSPQMRLIALLGALAAVMLAAAMFFFTRSGGDESASLSEAELAQALAPLRKAKAAAATPAAPKPATKPASKPATKTPAVAPKAKAKAKAAPPPLVTETGVPWALAQALRKDPVVVVALYAAGSEVDQYTLDEARAGAQAAGAGFLALDVLAKRNAEPLATFLGGVAEPPLVLVYQRPAALWLSFAGYVDHQTVAQAAHDAGARNDG